MNNPIGKVWWQHGTAVVLAAAPLFGVAANAAPRGVEEALGGTGKSGSEVTRLVTGDPAQINAVVAGVGATAILAINPVNPPTGLPAYPAGVSIVGNELRIDRASGKAGFRAWFNVQLSNWDPNGLGPPIGSWQVKIDETGYYQSDCKDLIPNDGTQVGADLRPAVVACPGDDASFCVAAFGESWAPCNVHGPGDADDYCDAGYLDLGANRPDSWCSPSGGSCNTGGVAIGTYNYNFFAVSNAGPTGHPDQVGTCVGGPRIGQGCNTAANCSGGVCTGPKLPNYYGGTLVLDLPAGAKGKYTVELNHDETFVAIYFFQIDTLQETGFVVNFVTGSCCFGLGTPDAGCVDSCIIRSDCNALPGPRVFTPEDHCPPQGSDCSRFLGACCETINGECLDEVLASDCQGTHRVWTSGTSCGEAACIADTGACCDHDPFGPCTDDTALSDCQCATCTWHKLQDCAEINCAPTPIPTVSEWGLAIMTLLLLTGVKILFTRSHVYGSEHRAQAR